MLLGFVFGAEFSVENRCVVVGVVTSLGDDFFGVGGWVLRSSVVVKVWFFAAVVLIVLVLVVVSKQDWNFYHDTVGVIG